MAGSSITGQGAYWPAPYTMNPGQDLQGYNQQNIWSQAMSQALGIPAEWTRTQGMTDEYVNAAQGMTAARAPENELKRMSMANTYIQQQMDEQARLQEQARTAMWGRIAPLLSQWGIGGTTEGGGTSGGGSPLSTALSSLELNPIRLQSEEARRKIYAGGGSKQYRQNRLGTEAGTTQSAIAQAISGGRGASMTAGSNIIASLLRQLSQGG